MDRVNGPGEWIQGDVLVFGVGKGGGQVICLFLLFDRCLS